MPKTFLRIVAFLLIACLVTDMVGGNVICAIAYHAVDHLSFEEQALAARSPWVNPAGCDVSLARAHQLPAQAPIPSSPVPSSNSKGVIFWFHEVLPNLLPSSLSSEIAEALNGFDVISTNDPAQAKRFLEELANRITLLVTDVFVSNGSGNNFARRAREMLPTMPILFWTDRPTMVASDLSDPFRIVTKRFSGALVPILRELVAQDSQSLAEITGTSLRSIPDRARRADTALRELGFPPLRSVDPQKILKNSLSVGLYSSKNPMITNQVSLLEELARSEKVNGIAVIDPNDLVFDADGSWCGVRCRAGIVFHNGWPAWVEFETPVPLHYVVSYSQDQNESLQASGVPMPEHPLTEEYVGEKDIMVSILRARGIAVPQTLALIVKESSRPTIAARRLTNPDTVYLMAEGPALQSDMRSAAVAFMDRHALDEAVLKPNRGSGGAGVLIFNRQQIDQAVEHILKEFRQGHNVLLQERIVPPGVNDWNLRVYISLDSTEEPVISAEFVVRTGRSGQPINISRGARTATLEDTLGAIGQLGQEAVMRDRVTTMCKQIYHALRDAMIEDGLLLNSDMPSDFMGADIILRLIDGELIPYNIELNGYHSGAMWDMDRLFRRKLSFGQAVDSDRIGRGCRHFASLIAYRAQKYVVLLPSWLPAIAPVHDSEHSEAEAA